MTSWRRRWRLDGCLAYPPVGCPTLIGQVGNSGNTSEPHLHIDAAIGKYQDEPDMSENAKAVPILFNGKFLIRNDRVTH